MLSKAKTIAIATVFAGLVLSLNIALGQTNGIGDVHAASQISGNHYTAKEATFSEPGCKEYWIDCLTKEIYFTKPSTGVWHDNGVAVPVSDPTDPRYVPSMSVSETPTQEDIESTTINKEDVTVEDQNNNDTGLIIVDQDGKVGSGTITEDSTFNVVSYQGDNKTVVIPEGIITLDTYNAGGSSEWNGNPFDGTNKTSNANIIETVVIPESVKYLHVSCFKNMPNLKTVVIGAAEIYYGAFANCPNLKSVYIKDSCKKIAEGAFITSGASDLKIYCEATSKPSGWKENWNIKSWSWPVSLYEATFGVAY